MLLSFLPLLLLGPLAFRARCFIFRPLQARPLLEEALTARRETLGDRHPDTLGSINNLGNLLMAQGKLDEVRSRVRWTARLVPWLHAVWWTACQLVRTLCGHRDGRALGELVTRWSRCARRGVGMCMRA